MEPGSFGKALMVMGIAIVVIGALIAAAPHVPLGRLPGDFHWKVGGADVYVPFTTCLIVSALLSLVLWLFRR